MTSTAEQRLAVIDWFASGSCAKRATINKNITSYGIKHLVELARGLYVSNESCIDALKELGFRAQRVRGTPNYRFNIHVFNQG